MIALDASILIAQINADDDLHSAATDLLARLSPEPLCVSPISLAEVLVAPARADRLEAAKNAIDRLNVAEIPLEAGAAARLAALRAESGLKLPDCCVVLAAEQAGGALATFDKRLARAAGELGLVVHA